MVLHAKYPNMERQDLTQSQLGALKFMLLVGVVHQSPQPHQHPLLLQKHAQSLHNDSFSQHMAAPDIAADLSFFNQRIRPSLNNSRLQFGPPAVRAAVGSAASSPRMKLGNGCEAFLRPTAQVFHPQFFEPPRESDPAPLMITSKPSSAPMSGDSLQSFSSANLSLLKALEAEQEAHGATKLQLELEIKAHGEAEAETQRLAEHNKALLNAIKLLQSTIKHMVQKEPRFDSNNESAVHDAVLQYSSPAEYSNVDSSILYDVPKNYKVPPKTTRNGAETTAVINLDLLNTPDTNDRSENAELELTLRRQIGMATDSVNKEDAHSEYPQNLDGIVGNGVKTTSVANGDGLCNNDNPQPPEVDLNKAVPDGGSAHDDKTQRQLVEEQARLTEFSYTLPESFLRKYGKKPTDAERKPKVAAAKENKSKYLEAPRRETLTAATTLKKRQSLDCSTQVIYMPDSPILNWKVNSGHAQELRGRSAETWRESDFAEHPIRYVPAMSDHNIFRTTMIDFIPFGTPYCDVLAQVRGGTLESIQLYGPVGDATDFVTARIVYTSESGANELYRRGQDPGIRINGCPVRVWQVLEPTYPTNKELEEAIYINGYTRILIIDTPMVEVEQVLKRKLRKQIEAGFILDISRSHDDISVVEFTSIEEATKALERFLDDPDLAGADFDFDDDPCAANYA